MNRWTYKKLKSSLVLAMVCALAMAFFAFSGQDQAGISAAAEDAWLVSLGNPFVGEWASALPGTDTIALLKCGADGSCRYEVADMGISGSGGYVAFNGLLLTWAEGEGAETYTYEVQDNDTIITTELIIDEEGGRTSGETSILQRVPGTAAPEPDAAFKLDNAFLGKWQATIPSAGAALTFAYKDDGTFEYEMEGVPAEQGGTGTGLYIIYGDYQVSYLDFEGAAIYRFTVIDADNISVTELEPDAQGDLVPGDTALFTKIPARSLSDWEGTWNNFYSYFDEPALDEAYQILGEREGKTADEVKARYKDGLTYQCEIAALTVQDGTIAFYDQPQAGQSGEHDAIAYAYAGDVEDANGRSWSNFEATGASPYAHLLLLPAEADVPGETMVHFHFRYGNTLDELLSADGWYATMVAYDSDLQLLIGHMTQED